MDYAVIMAGGSGKRLWPLSRRKRPKQVLRLLQGRTLLEACFERLRPVFDLDRILVLTSMDYRDLVCQDLPGLPARNIIAEPVVRDTAGAIGLAAAILVKQDPHATMAVVTADQVIRPADVFQRAIGEAIGYVDSNTEALVTFGIKPTFASTQYGYIKCRLGQGSGSVVRVEAFKEKPDLAHAQVYVSSGQYSWNSGMFVWKAETILRNLTQFVPEAVEPLRAIQGAWGTAAWDRVMRDAFAGLPRISIDVAVMEKADDVFAIQLDCDWMDLGSFTSLAGVVPTDGHGNVVAGGNTELLDCRDNIMVTEDHGHLIAAIGLKDMVVVHSRDATLVCPKDQTERLKELLDHLDHHGKIEYL